MANPLLISADLLHYPDSGRLVRRVGVAEFYRETVDISLEKLQELYTTTFDLNPVATLEVGWHLWGEQYERGRFLADLRERQEALSLDAGSELPDHLTVLLPMLAVTGDSQLAAHVSMALSKIQASLDAQNNPYRHVARTACTAVNAIAEARQEGRPE